MPDLARPSSRAAYILALSGAPRVGAWTALTAARAFPTPDELFAASKAELQEALGKRFATPLSKIEPTDWGAFVERAQGVIARHEDAGVRIIAIDDDDYPPLMAAAPKQMQAVILYCRGDERVLQHLDAVAVIGTREPTEKGGDVAGLLTRGLVTEGFTVVSGLAKGIDSIGHRATLEAGGTTVAVLGTAIDKVYPAENRDLADEILSTGGTLVSEYPMGMPTSGRHFVERDRLQTAVSIGVLPVQTGLDGGTMHAVRAARQSERAVVVPKPVTSEAELPQYGGIAQLIESGTAGIIGSREDYPRLAAFLRAHRNWLLGDRSTARPRFDGMAEPSPTENRDDPEELRLGL